MVPLRPDLKLHDLIENNEDFIRRVDDFFERQRVAGTFISSLAFIKNETDQFKTLLTEKKPELVSIKVNNMPEVEPFNVSEYAYKVYQYLIQGRNLPVQQVIDEAKKKCEEAKQIQLRQYGRLFAYTPCDGSFTLTLFNAIARGVGFALYVKFLHEQIPESVTAISDFANGTGLAAIFSSPQAYQICLELLESLEITLDGKNRLTKGKAGILIGAITALKQTPGILKLERLTDMEFLKLLNKHLGTSYTSIRKTSKIYKESYADAKTFLKQHLKKGS